MLYIVLALVVAAFGLLIAALTTANTLWAWISVVLSVVAAALLVTDWLSGRRKARAGTAAKPTVVTVGGTRRDDRPASPDEDEEPESFPEDHPESFVEPPVQVPAEQPGFDAEATGHIEPVAVVADPVDTTGEPDEEPTDASDLLVVAGLNVEVRVVDEHPRYHLATCSWLGPRPTIPIPVSEARQLGFTPCSRCGPDGVLAARHRAAR